MQGLTRRRPIPSETPGTDPSACCGHSWVQRAARNCLRRSGPTCSPLPPRSAAGVRECCLLASELGRVRLEYADRDTGNRSIAVGWPRYTVWTMQCIVLCSISPPPTAHHSSELLSEIGPAVHASKHSLPCISSLALDRSYTPTPERIF